MDPRVPDLLHRVWNAAVQGKKMKFRNLLCVAAMAIAGPMSAHAWTSVASSGESDHYFTNWPKDTPQAASAEALKLCGYGGGNCRLIGTPQQNKMIVVFAGEASTGFGADQNGEKAALAARKDCERLSKRCEPVHVHYAEGDLYAAIAKGSEKGHYVHTNALSQQEADRAVLALCSKDVRKQECKLNNMPGMNKYGYYANAVSSASGVEFMNRHSDKDAAAKNAMDNCKAAGNTDCIMTFQDVYNDGVTQMSDAQRAWILDFTPYTTAGKERRERQRRGS